MLLQSRHLLPSALWALCSLPSAQVSRGLAAAAASATEPGIIEIREYTLKPEGVKDFLKISKEYADVRKELLPFLGMFTCDVGGTLNRVIHFYHYKDHEQREVVRSKAGKDPRWTKYVDLVRPYAQHQEAKIMLEAQGVYQALGMPPTSQYESPQKAEQTKIVYEMRSYQLHPGYGSVPKVIDAFKTGLPDKVAADPEGQLVFFGHTDVGMLNNVVELWRYPSAQSCIRARQAARAVPKWRDTIGTVTPGVQHFTSSFLNPTAFSPWQ